MTSINLVSPVGNGHTYSVRFREPLVIEPKSSVYLNFAKFKRNSSIYFSQDQTIQVILKSVLPAVLPAATGTKNTTMENDGIITIPAINPETGLTGYTPKELERTIAIELGGDSEAGTFGMRKNADGTPSQLFLYEPIFELSNNKTINIGFYKDYQLLDLPSVITMRATDKILADTATAGITYKSTSTNAGEVYYDSYAISNEHYDFSFASELGTATENHNIIQMKTNTPIGTQTGGVWFGLTSHEIMDAQANTAANTNWTGYQTAANDVFTYGTVNNRTPVGGATARTIPALYKPNGTGSVTAAEVANQADAKTYVPQSFLGIEITGSNHPTDPNTLILWRGGNTTSRFNAPAKPASVMNSMKRIWSTPLANLLKGSDPAHTKVNLAFQSYWAEGFSGKGRDKLEFRVYNMINSNYIDTSNLIYDSINSIRWLSYTFFQQSAATGTDLEKRQKAGSQIPFNVLCSAQVAGEGWEEIKMAGFIKTGSESPTGLASNTKPITLVQQYELKCSTELARFLGVNQTEGMNPNMAESTAARIVKTDADQHTDESYSIFVKNLPIKAYKNIQSKAMSAGNNIQAAGYSQPILHDIPTPYSDSKTINSGSGDIIVGTFQPSIKKTLDLDNNRQVLNALDIEIRDIETNEIAEGLAGSVINFTIQKGMDSCH